MLRDGYMGAPPIIGLGGRPIPGPGGCPADGPGALGAPEPGAMAPGATSTLGAHAASARSNSTIGARGIMVSKRDVGRFIPVLRREQGGGSARCVIPPQPGSGGT